MGFSAIFGKYPQTSLELHVLIFWWGSPRVFRAGPGGLVILPSSGGFKTKPAAQMGLQTH